MQHRAVAGRLQGAFGQAKAGLGQLGLVRRHVLFGPDHAQVGIDGVERLELDFLAAQTLFQSLDSLLGHLNGLLTGQVVLEEAAGLVALELGPGQLSLLGRDDRFLALDLLGVLHGHATRLFQLRLSRDQGRLGLHHGFPGQRVVHLEQRRARFHHLVLLHSTLTTRPGCSG